MNPFDPSKRNDEIRRLYDLSGGRIQKVNPTYYPKYRDLNLVNVDTTKKIYRIFSYDRFIQLLESKMNTLVPTRKWDDPLENFLLSCDLTYKEDHISLSDIRNSWYGQCWTEKEECDGMWHTQTKNDSCRTVKVKTTVGTLFEEFYDFSHEYHVMEFFMGKVEYKKQDEIKRCLEKIGEKEIFSKDNRSHLMSLLVKREEFSYEHELRLLYCYPKSSPCHPPVYSYAVNPNKLFEEVVLDPWTNDKDFTSELNQIRSLGYNKKVTRSELYKSFKGEIII